MYCLHYGYLLAASRSLPTVMQLLADIVELINVRKSRRQTAGIFQSVHITSSFRGMESRNEVWSVLGNCLALGPWHRRHAPGMRLLQRLLVL